MQQLIIFSLSFLLLIPGLSAQQRQIAITIDDAPMGEGPFFSGERRGQMLVQRLRQAGVEQAMFFVITGKIDEEGRKRLSNYVDAGHRLANHTDTHPSAHRIAWERMQQILPQLTL